jgi:hypothetical protein
MFHALDAHFLSFLLLSRFASVTVHCFALYSPALTMERLFSPCTRYRDRVGSRRSLDEVRFYAERWLQDLLELNLEVSTEELLSTETAFTYVDLYAMLGNKNTALWLTPHAAISSSELGGKRGAVYFCARYLRDENRFRVKGDAKSFLAVASSSEALLEIADVIRRLLLADVSGVNEIEFGSCTNELHGRWRFDADSLSFDADSLTRLMEQCQSLKALKLDNIALDNDHIRMLGGLSRPGLEIELNSCRITGAAAVVLA